MNTWRARCAVAVLMIFVMLAHGEAAQSPREMNTPAGMLAFHGSAALLDWLLLCATPLAFDGRLCTHTQYLFLASIVGNAAGWILYMSYAPPSIYNVFMWVLTAAQLVRIFAPDRYVDNFRFDLVRHRDRTGGGLHT